MGRRLLRRASFISASCEREEGTKWGRIWVGSGCPKVPLHIKKKSQKISGPLGSWVRLAPRVHLVRGPTPQRGGWTVTGPSLAGRLHSLGFRYLVRSRKSHATRRRGHLRVAISTVPDLGSGRVDMLTIPVAAARAAVATGAWNRNTTCI